MNSTKQAQHTPGPWKVAHDGSVVIGGEACIPYSVLWASSTTSEGRIANANLIASAPDLLVAAEKALRFVDLITLKEGNNLMAGELISDLLLATIRKAKGEA